MIFAGIDRPRIRTWSLRAAATGPPAWPRSVRCAGRHDPPAARHPDGRGGDAGRGLWTADPNPSSASPAGPGRQDDTDRAGDLPARRPRDQVSLIRRAPPGSTSTCPAGQLPAPPSGLQRPAHHLGHALALMHGFEAPPNSAARRARAASRCDLRAGRGLQDVCVRSSKSIGRTSASRRCIRSDRTSSASSPTVPKHCLHGRPAALLPLNDPDTIATFVVAHAIFGDTRSHGLGWRRSKLRVSRAESRLGQLEHHRSSEDEFHKS